MRILLKEGADAATVETILTLPVLMGSTLETLSGKTVAKGVIAEADEETVTSALSAGARARKGDYVTDKDLLRGVRWLNKALGEYELGSKIGLIVSARSIELDDSEAKRPNRAEGLTEGDAVAIGPRVSPKTHMNARGRVVSIIGEQIEVELDAGDRDRIRRASGKEMEERATFPLDCVEKVE